MFSLNSITKRVATVAKGVMLLGTAIFGWGSVANAAEIAVVAGPTVEKVATVKVEHNLKTVVEALAIIDPVWAASRPKVEVLQFVPIFTDYYYRYTGPTNDDADLQNPAYWTYLSTGTPPPFPCNGSDPLICVVKLLVAPGGMATHVPTITFDDLEGDNSIITYRDENPN